MKRVRSFGVLSLLLLCLAGFSGAAVAMDMSYMPTDRQGHIIVGNGLGFALTGGEASFLDVIEADYYILPNWSAGGQMLFSVHPDLFVLGFQGVGKYTLDLEGTEWLDRTKPHGDLTIGFGIGFNGGTNVAFLGGFGFGVDYFLNSVWAVGTNMLFEFSDDMGGENFSWMWKVAQIKYLF